MGSNPEDNQKMLKQVCSLIRSCLISNKHGVPVDSIYKDYRSIVGEGIPYRKLGYDTLENFLMYGAREVCRVRYNQQGELILEGIPDEATAHIANMVKQQRSSSKKRSKPSRPPRRLLPGQRQWQPPAPNRQFGGSGRFPPSGGRHQPYLGGPQMMGRMPQRNPGGGGQQRFRPSQNKGNLRTPTGQFRNGQAQKTSPPQQQNGVKTVQARLRPSAPFQRPQQQQQQQKTVGSVPQSRPANAHSYVKDLERYFDQNGLGALEFKTASIENKKQRKTSYMSTIIVHGKSYQTFPHEYPTKEQAEEAAAKEAVQKLGIKDADGSGSVSASTESPSITDMSTVADQIVAIVGSRSNGVWSTQIDVEYKRKHGKPLPDRWPEVLCSATKKLRVDSPIAGRYIILPNIQPEVPSPVAVSSGSNLNTPATVQKPVEVKAEQQQRPPPIVFPQDSYWEVYITYAHSTVNVCLRLLGEEYSNKFDDLSTNMELFFFDLNKMPKVESPQVGVIYAAKLDTDWHRVEVINVHGIDVTCYFIDHGDEDVVKISDLRYIDSKFLQLPAQAITVRLAGLEDFADNQNALTHVNNLILGESLVGEVLSRGDDGLSMILYDTSGKDDVNLNEKLLELLQSEENAHKLPPVGGDVIPVFLSFIGATGDLYVQKENKTYSMIEQVIADSTEQVLRQTAPKGLSAEKLYLAKYDLDNQLYRAALLTTQVRDGKVPVYFVDFGNTENIRTEDIREISSGCEILAVSPHQALKCRLSNVLPSPTHKWSSAATEKLRSLVPEEKQVLLKVVSSSDPPEVELFERSADETLISVNRALVAAGPELFHSGSSSGSSAQESPSMQSPAATSPRVMSPVSPQEDLMSVDLASLKSLVPTFVPEIGEFFDVNVTLAANPGNFTIQPWRDGNELEKLQDEMNAFYSKKANQRAPLTLQDLASDRYFVALHTDNLWYRIRVDNTLDEYTVAVKFVDFGDFSMVAVQNIQPLWPQFRNLPMQAIKAGLADIIPVNGDWTAQDTVWFNQRVVDKQFVTIIKDINYEEDDTLRLSLSLIDTTHPREDICIEKELVAQGRAVELCL